MSKIRSFIRNLHKNIDITYVYNDLESAIFYIDIQLVYSDDMNDVIIKNICSHLKIKMETYHESNIYFIQDLNIRLPHSKSFYNNKTYNEIKQGSSYNTVMKYFHIEMDKNFDLYIYVYYVNSEYRPVPIKELMSDMELISSKSKTCAGIPYHKSGHITHLDYLHVLQQNKEYLNKVSFFTIKREKGVTKTIRIQKKALHHFDVKRWHKNTETSYSYGNCLIPKNQQSYFAGDSEVSLVSESDGESDHSDNVSEDDEMSEIVNSKMTNNIFSNRVLKYHHLYPNRDFAQNSQDESILNENEKNSETEQINNLDNIPSTSNNIENEQEDILLSRKNIPNVISDSEDEISDFQNRNIHKKRHINEPFTKNKKIKKSGRNKFKNRFINYEAVHDDDDDDDDDDFPDRDENEDKYDSDSDFIDNTDYDTSLNIYSQSDLKKKKKTLHFPLFL